MLFWPPVVCECLLLFVGAVASIHPYLLIQLLKFSTETSNPVAPHCRNHGLPNKMSAGTRCFGFLWTQLRRNSRSSLENFLSLVLGGRLGAGSFNTVWGPCNKETEKNRVSMLTCVGIHRQQVLVASTMETYLHHFNVGSGFLVRVGARCTFQQSDPCVDEVDEVDKEKQVKEQTEAH